MFNVSCFSSVHIIIYFYKYTVTQQCAVIFDWKSHIWCSDSLVVRKFDVCGKKLHGYIFLFNKPQAIHSMIFDHSFSMIFAQFELQIFYSIQMQNHVEIIWKLSEYIYILGNNTYSNYSGDMNIWPYHINLSAQIHFERFDFILFFLFLELYYLFTHLNERRKKHFESTQENWLKNSNLMIARMIWMTYEKYNLSVRLNEHEFWFKERFAFRRTLSKSCFNKSRIFNRITILFRKVCVTLKFGKMSVREKKYK